MVAVLKGIRNIRHLEDVLIDKVVHCAVDNNVKARVRAAALEAFQADPCSAKVRNYIIIISSQLYSTIGQKPKATPDLSLTWGSYILRSSMIAHLKEQKTRNF